MTEVEGVQRVRLKGRLFHLFTKLFRVQPVVRFTDVQLLADDLPPPFGTMEGDYEYADVGLLGNGTVTYKSIPDSLECPTDFVIYASNADSSLLSCLGYGPDHAILRTAREVADAAAARIACKDGCVKSVVEIWRGWSCEWMWDAGIYYGYGAVELKVSCTAI